MIPGPRLYYKCPKCKQVSYRETLISGNTFGAKYYTDGKMDAPMLPSFPEVIKCECCDTIYWLNNKNRKWFQKQGTGGCRAYFMDESECNEAIEKKYTKIKEKKKF